jgi:uncharacterized protein (TIRG00374 family)
MADLPGSGPRGALSQPVQKHSNPMKKLFQNLLWAVLFLAVLIVVVREMKHNPEWQAFSWHDFWQHLMHVRVGYLLLSLAVGLFCYFIRALRWREFLNPVKRTSLSNLWSAVVIGFAAVSLLGRAGELTRPFVLSRKENLPLSIALTTVVVERIFDLITILFLFLFNLLFFRLGNSVSAQNSLVFHLFSRAAAIVFAVFLAVTLLLFFFQMNAVRWIDFCVEHVGLIPQRFKKKVEGFLKSFVDGLAFIAHPRPLIFSVFYSLGLWLMIIAGTYWCVRGFNLPAPFTFSMTVVLLTFSAMGAVIQLPGVGGGFQALTLYALVGFLGIEPAIASGITLVSWVLAFFPVVIIGLVDLFRGGWSLRALTREAEKEAAAVITAASPTKG